MPEDIYAAQRERLENKKTELSARLERVTANLRRGHDPDSKERAKELLSLIHISEPTRPPLLSRMPSSA